MRTLDSLIQTEFVHNLYQVMSYRGVKNHADLARKTGLPRKTVQGWFSEDKMPSQRSLDVLNEYFKVTNEYWLWGDERA